MLICSPAFILFPVLDPEGGNRKEIILFALLSTLCYHLTTNTKTSKRLPVYLGIAAAFIALSHEMLIVYLPYVIGALILSDNGLSDRAKKGIIVFIPAVVITALVMVFGRGDKQTAIEICNSLTMPPPDCISPGVIPGAISFLGENLSTAHNFVVESILPTTIVTYIFTTILSFIPLVLIFFSKLAPSIKENSHLKFWLALCILSTIIGSLPLFWIVADYGRLIHIHIVCMTLLLLMKIQENNDKPLHLTFRQVPIWLLSFIFIISWRLIHWMATIENSFPIKAVFERFFD
jgi:hypothetical protein